MSGSQTLDRTVEGINRFKAAFGSVESSLIDVRQQKVNDAISELEAQMQRLAKQEGLVLAELEKQRHDLEDSKAKAFNISNAEQSRDALEVVKHDARQKAADSVKIVDEFIADWNIVDQQRTKARYLVQIARRVKVGEPLEWLVKPADLIDQAITRLDKTKTVDARAALDQWNQDWGAFNSKSVAKYKEEVLERPLVMQDDTLQKISPNGPEAQMQKAFRDRYVDSLVDMKLTALANGVDIDQLSISLGEALAISEYTSGAYKDINGMLLGLPNAKRTKRREDDCKITIDVLKQSVAKLTEWRTWPTSRGENKFPGWDAQYKKGNTFTLKAFWSSGIGFAFEGAIQITINGKAKSTGKNVAALSQHPNENEILFPPGTKFKVTERRDGKDGFVYVALKEV